MTAPDRATLESWLEHWRDESDAAFLYRALAGVERDTAKSDVYSRLAGVEELSAADVKKARKLLASRRSTHWPPPSNISAI